MKKLIALICMIACIFGLTACGEVEYTEYEQQKLQYAEQYAGEMVMPLMQNLCADVNEGIFDEMTFEEVEYMVYYNSQMEVDGYAMITGIESFKSAIKEIGEILFVGEAEAEIDDDQIIVHVQVTGEKKNAEAEVIVSNDTFMRLEAVSLNPISSVGESMTKAALNTLIGMGTVFVVLILISAIISAFGIIPKIQAKFRKKEEQSAQVSSVAVPVEESTEEEVDDTELVAVIAAAIAEYEGATSTDGFVVRSIRKVNRSRR